MPRIRTDCLTLLLSAALCVLPACQQDMASQPSARPDEPSAFFLDGRTNRPLPAGTIARGHLKIDRLLFTGTTAEPREAAVQAAAAVGLATRTPLTVLALGLAGEAPDAVDTFPFPITRAVLEHGYHRYMIVCVVCHDPLGTGQGMIVQRGYTKPPSYHIPRLRQAPVGHFYVVMTRGYGSMPDYSVQTTPRDRWAIAAYIRALQLSQRYPEAKLTDAMRRDWQKQMEATP